MGDFGGVGITWKAAFATVTREGWNASGMGALEDEACSPFGVNRVVMGDGGDGHEGQLPCILGCLDDTQSDGKMATRVV